jgi:hypothetical protein
VELIKNNAKLGAEIAVCLSSKIKQEDSKNSKSSSVVAEPKKITIIGGASVDIIAQSDSIRMDSG